MLVSLEPTASQSRVKYSTTEQLRSLFRSLTQKNCEDVCLNVSFFDVTSSCFLSLVPCLKFTLRYVAAKQVTDVSLILKDRDTDTESENLSSLIRLSVSDGQKTDSSKDVSFIGI